MTQATKLSEVNYHPISLALATYDLPATTYIKDKCDGQNNHDVSLETHPARRAQPAMESDQSLSSLPRQPALKLAAAEPTFYHQDGGHRDARLWLQVR
jgi:hypothetical protein